ncbi:WecB/TagA/CpsF family glycosyltransferase [Arthrobacter sp. CC3]|uniref:WecB/TagA/CpsF family glycosyltransferase n=1 Tax=Arthrobacter sp. CC3 TaxID=3029185 RepID=UPI003266EF5B
MGERLGAGLVLSTWEDFSANGNILTSTDNLLNYLEQTRKGRIQTVNLQHVYVAAESVRSLDDLRAATKVTADGWPLRWYTRVWSGTAIDRVTGRQALDLILEGETPHVRIATIGGSSKASDDLQKVVEAQGKSIVYRNERQINECDFGLIVGDVAKTQPDLILTALGSPRGETLGRLLHESPEIHAMVIGVGGAIEMWHGSTPGAPIWAQRLGCEWLYRLVREPRRLFRRYVFECAPLMLAMLKRVGLGRRLGK